LRKSPDKPTCFRVEPQAQKATKLTLPSTFPQPSGDQSSTTRTKRRQEVSAILSHLKSTISGHIKQDEQVLFRCGIEAKTSLAEIVSLDSSDGGGIDSAPRYALG
jgi:hypothetical protein